MTGAPERNVPSAVLTSAVRLAPAALADLRMPHPTVEDGRVELHLRDAVAAVERAARPSGRIATARSS